MNTWTINEMKCKISENGLSNIVESIRWTLSRTTTFNGLEYTREMGGSTTMPNPTPETFTNYADLTHEQVVTWIEANTDVDMINSYIDGMLEETVSHIPLQPPC
jgi:hypothetical protein